MKQELAEKMKAVQDKENCSGGREGRTELSDGSPQEPEGDLSDQDGFSPAAPRRKRSPDSSNMAHSEESF